MVGPSEGFSKNIGNSYTGAVYSNITALIDSQRAGLEGKSVGVFSYGSGAIATMFGMRGGKGPSAAFSLDGIAKKVDLQARLGARREASPEEFTAALKMREGSYGKSGITPVGSVDNVPAGAFYLKEVTATSTRVYERK
jgi:hydroxymethylglutaryl-CoA synthase